MITFEDAQALAREYPTTFEAPSIDELNEITVGMHVKICTCGERFWVRVDARDGDKLRGVIDNDLVFTHCHGLEYNDIIEFGTRHVYSIFTGHYLRQSCLGRRYRVVPE